MTTAPCSGFLTHLRGIVFAREADSLSDAQLLQGFFAHHQEAAFAALVRRHGPMVLGVCRRVLHNFSDAEDAFQATFLVLARKAASLGRPEQVSNWLYGVAYRTALKARSRQAQRLGTHESLGERDIAAPADQDSIHDLEPMLDEELRRLPERYRAPLVLCYLEGKTKQQAAHCLGRPEGTISTQLARGRRMLRRRLVRRGAALSTAALATALSQATASAAVPLGSMESLSQAALAVAAGEAVTELVSAPVAMLMRGVLRAMFWAKVKSVCVLLFGVGLLITACATGILAQSRVADDGEAFAFQAPSDRFADDDAQPPKKDKGNKDQPSKGKQAAAQHKATEERVQELPKIGKAALLVRTNNGAVNVITDAGKSEGKLVAKVTAAGATEEEAKSRLAKVKVTAALRDNDQVLAIDVEFPDEHRSNDGCSFDVTVPATNGVTIHTGNGAVNVQKVTGPVTIDSGNGAVKIDEATGSVKAHSGNGPLTALHVQGEVDLDTGNGAVTYETEAKPAAFKLKSGNGAVTVRLHAGGDGTINASSGNGAITVNGAAAEQTVTGAKGSKTVKLSPKDISSTIRTGNGPITIQLGK